MDAAFQKSKAAGKRIKKKRVQQTQKRDGFSGEQRRLAQLVISLVLFLAVFIGRDLYPEQIGAWSEMIGSDIKVSDAFRVFGQALNGEESFGHALKSMGLALLGDQPDPQPNITDPPVALPSVLPLKDTGRFGLDQAREYGVTAAMPVKTDPIPTEIPIPTTAPSPEPEVVTAVAQAYAADGTSLPSNVSFLYYELGLEKTVVPVSGSVTSGFGYRKSPTSGKREFHLALDIAADKGTPIAAFADGVVRYIGESNEFGLYLMIDHANGVSTFYAHCSRLMVKKGESVSCGQTIALVGDTGNVTGAHLHLTILKDNIRLDPAHYVDV